MVGWKNFRNLSREELELVDQNRFEASFKPGEMILKQGSPATHAVFISNGIARICSDNPGQKRILLQIALPTQMLVGPGVFSDHGNSWTVSAISRVEACFISLAILKKLAGSNAEFASGMIADMSEKSFILHQKLLGLVRKKMPGRLAEALLFFSTEVFRSDSFDMMLTRQELGEMTNMTKESVVRILRELTNSGLIRSDSARMVILDRDKLRQLSERG